MNEFTKDELRDLWCYIREFMGNGYDHAHDHKGYALMRKLKSMIDNYCDHPEKTYHRKTGQRICPHCDVCFSDNGDDIENRLKGYEIKC